MGLELSHRQPEAEGLLGLASAKRSFVFVTNSQVPQRFEVYSF
jgi:hypothetical protein